MLFVGTEHDVLASALGHVLLKNYIQTICLFQRTAQCFQIPFRFIAHSLAFGTADASFIALQVLLVGEYGEHIFGRSKNAANDGLAQRDFRGNIAVE